jgi:tetratricopeptide (TPR) repeat protein
MSVAQPQNNHFRSKYRWAFGCILAGMLAQFVVAQEPLPLEEASEKSVVAPDLEMIYGKTESAKTVQDYSTIIEFCRTVLGDSTRPQEDRLYAKTLMSWGMNRRGEARSDQAAIMVREQNLDEAAKLDAMARKDFETAIQLDATRWRAHHNLGIIHAIQGKTEEAIASFSETIRLNANFPNAYFNRGELYFRANQLETALGDYNRVVQLSSDDSSAYSARAHTLYAMGKADEALADYEKAMTLAPQSVDAATEYADTCQALGKWKEASKAYQQALQLDNANVRTLQNAAWMMATCPDDFYRNGNAALKTAKRAVQLASSSPNAQVLDVLAAAQATSGDFEAAQNSIAAALRSATDPNLRAELQMRGRLYQKKTAFVQPKR